MAGAQTLVQDINQNPATNNYNSSNPSRFFTNQHGVTFFSAVTEETGYELFKTDGVTTELVKDIYPGTYSSSPIYFAELGSGDVVFAANGPLTGNELWITDGTAAGTQPLEDLYPGLTHSYPRYLHSYDGKVVFFATTPTAGREIFITDGTENGTVLLKDTIPGSTGMSDFSQQMVEVNGDLMFVTNDSVNWKLWKTDGVSTSLVKNVGTNDVGVQHMAELNGQLLFTAHASGMGEELWCSDGTTAGTHVLKELVGGIDGGQPANFTRVGQELFFTALGDGVGRELFKTDGTAAGTVLVKDINIFGYGFIEYWTEIVAVGQEVYFTAYANGEGVELWKSDGTDAGTFMVADLTPGYQDSSFGSFAALNGECLFVHHTAAMGWELWKTDGTAVGTVPLPEIQPGSDSSSPRYFHEFGSSLLFSASTLAEGFELYTTDGNTITSYAVLSPNLPTTLDASPSLMTPNGRNLFFRAFNPLSSLWVVDSVTLTATELLDKTPADMTNFGNGVVFRSWDSATGYELYHSDGTPGGTGLLKELRPGPDSSSPDDFFEYRGQFLFTANDGINGTELWISDGTDAGTTLLADLNPGAGSSWPEEFVEYGGKVYFEATGPSGSEVYFTDGTAPGTGLLADIEPGSDGSFPNSFHVFGDWLLFRASSDATGTEWYRTDGTQVGTTILLDIYPGPGKGATRRETYELNGLLYFYATDPAYGIELWVSDATPAGTQLLADINPGPDSSFASFSMAVSDTHLLFLADDGSGTGDQPWASDGSAAGTQQLGTFESVDPDLLMTNGTDLFFPVRTGNRDVLWKSDGTSLGTSLVKVIQPAGGYFQDYEHTPPGASDLLVFTATNGFDGNEVWTTDGTHAGTGQFVNIAPGSLEAAPYSYTRVGPTLFFVADDGATGRELHAIPVVDYGDYVAETFGAGCEGTGGLVPEVQLEGSPTVGDLFKVQLHDALPNSITAILLSFQGGGNYHLLDGCSIFFQPPFLSVLLPTDAQGSSEFRFRPSLGHVGRTLHGQFLTADPQGAYLNTASFSDAFEVVFGN